MAELCGVISVGMLEGSGGARRGYCGLAAGGFTAREGCIIVNSTNL